MWQQGPVWGGLERSPPPKTHYIKMGLKQVLPILALAATCHGAALPEAEHFDMDTVMDLVQEFIANPDPYMEAFGVRAKRHVEDLNRSGFKQFPIPFIGAEAVQVLNVGLATLVTVGGVLVLDANFGSDEGDGELLEAGAVQVLNVSLCPHTKGLHVGVWVGDELLHEVHHGVHVKVFGFR